MIEKLIAKFRDVELLDYIGGGDEIELTLYDKFNKGIDFECDVESIVEELKNHFYRVKWEVYNPNGEEDDGYEMAFIYILE